MADKTDKQANSEAFTGLLDGYSQFAHIGMLSSMATLMSTRLERLHTEREAYFNELRGIRDNYVVNGVYDIVTNDVFVDSADSAFISIEVPGNKELEEELNSLFTELNIPNLMVSIFPDLCHYGSYPLRPVLKDKIGLTALEDIYDPAQVLPICNSSNFPLAFFVSEKAEDNWGFINYSSRQLFKYANISEVIDFNISDNFLKLNIPDKIVNTIKSKLPTEIAKSLPSALKIRQSKSFIFGAVEKIKELALAEKISLYRDAAELLSPSVLGVPVPDAYDPAEMLKVVNKYDDLINGGIAKMNSVEKGEFTLQDIARIKVIPIAGDRSLPTPVETGRGMRVDDRQKLDQAQERALDAIGMPVEMFRANGNYNARSNVKGNIRYAKKIKNVQRSISRGLTNLALLHIAYRYPDLDITSDQINIRLRNNINIDELENLESQDLLIASATSVQGALEALEEFLAGVPQDKRSFFIDRNKFAEKFKQAMVTIGSPYSTTIIELDKDSVDRADMIPAVEVPVDSPEGGTTEPGQDIVESAATAAHTVARKNRLAANQLRSFAVQRGGKLMKMHGTLMHRYTGPDAVAVKEFGKELGLTVIIEGE